MRTSLCFLFFFFIVSISASGNYATPGTGVKWNLDNLVLNSRGSVTAGENATYTVIDTVFISLMDTLYINTDATVKFGTTSYFDVNGTLLINPPTGVTFTAQNIASGFLGVRIDSSNTTVLRKLTLEYANSLRLFDCSPLIDNCIFRNNTPTTAFGNAAISVFRANPLITNCQFLNNQRAAIQGGANINNAPKIIGCLFQGNNTLNQNVPQINLGATSTGNDTIRIINNQILRASFMSGAIAFLPAGDVYAVISGNVIKNNRYGIAFNGGTNIHALVSYNQIDSNNTQNDPNLGGSGINFTGGATAGPQSVVVTGNLIRWNLWGITLSPGSRPRPNLGNLTNADTTDDGRNQFIGNTNSNTPGIDLYNNTVDSIYAQNNYWGTSDTSEVEARIFHKPDNAALGLVYYLPFIKQAPLPVDLSAFTASVYKKDVLLKWKTLTETNSDHFVIERSADGRTFQPIGKVDVMPSPTSVRQYNYTDYDVLLNNTIYYRLQIVDKDSRYIYSPTVSVKLNGNSTIQVSNLYPSALAASQYLVTEIYSDKQQRITARFFDAQGKLISKTSKELTIGYNKLSLIKGNVLPGGTIYVNLTVEGFQKTFKVIRQ